MSIKDISGHCLSIGDHVRMNIAKIGEGDLDGVEFTASGDNYWRYMNQHPNEVYTVVGFDFRYDDCPYVLSGAMAGNTWSADELILVGEAKTRFELIKNMTFEEMCDMLVPMLTELCEDGVPTTEAIAEWLSGNPESEA